MSISGRVIMKFLNQAIDFTNLNEVVQMRLAEVVRRLAGFSKTTVIKAIKRFRNAIWICYSIDGVKCSCFFKEATVLRLLATIGDNHASRNFTARAIALIKKANAKVTTEVKSDSTGNQLIIRFDKLTAYTVSIDVIKNEWLVSSIKGYSTRQFQSFQALLDKLVEEYSSISSIFPTQAQPSPFKPVNSFYEEYNELKELIAD